MRDKPVIAITMGDPFGIGPEIICKSLQEKRIWSDCLPIVVGSKAPLEYALRCIASQQQICCIKNVSECTDVDPEKIYLIDIPYEFNFNAGNIIAENGRIVMEYMRKAHDIIMAGEADGTAGGPCHKAAMKLAGSPFAGATELYGHYANNSDVSGVTMLGNYCSFGVTNHMSLSAALKSLDYQKIKKKIIDVNNTMHMLGYNKPRIAIAGINPHSGEGGALGYEEVEFEIPAIESARKEGVLVDGPIPADFMYIKAQQGEYDAIISIFHDTKSIGSKLLAFTLKVPTAVVTVGLPYVRTSVPHGTAYDISYKNIADHNQMAHSIVTAAKLAFGMKKV